MPVDRTQYVARLTQLLGAGRVRHSINVADAAVELARRFAPELAQQAELAGLLHDHAKRLSDKELIDTARAFDLKITAGELRQPNLLHGKVGAALLAERFGIDDPQVQQAVADHVTGRQGMDRLSQILFVADQMAADREFPGVDELRAAAQTDLAMALLLAVKQKLVYVIRKNRPLDEQGIALYNDLVAQQHGAGGV